MLWKQQTFLTSRRDKIKNGPCVQDLLDAIPLPAALAIIKVPGHSKSDSLETKGNHTQCLRKKCCSYGIHRPNPHHGPQNYFPW